MTTQKKPHAEPTRGRPVGSWSRFWGWLMWDQRTWAILFLVGLTAMFLVRHTTNRTSGRLYAAGEVVISDIKAPRQFPYVDQERSEAERRAARDAVLPVYDFNSRASVEELEQLGNAFGALRAAQQAWFDNLYGPTADGGPYRAPYPLPAPESLRDQAMEALPEADHALLTAFYRGGYSPDLEEWIVQSVENAQRSKISADVEELRRRTRILVRDVHAGNEWEDAQPSRTLSLEEGRAQVRLRAAEDPPPGLSPEEAERLADLASGLLRPTLSPNVKETETRRARAADKVPPVIEVVPKGKIIVREGEVVSPRQASLLAALAEQTRSTLNFPSVLAYAALAAALLAFLWIFIDRTVTDSATRSKPLFSMVVLTTLCTVAMSAVALFVADTLTDALRGTWLITGDTLRYAAPWAAGAMVLALLASRPVAVAFTVLYSILMGLYLGGSYPLTLFCLLSGLGACFVLPRYKKRTDPLRASAIVSLVNVGAVGILHAYSPWLSNGSWSWWDYLSALCGGASVLIAFHLLTPMLEHGFGLMTGIRLLELGDPDNPLLRELAIRAPGTYQHSIAVGRLAEAAAEAIGANALLCRVGAMYHDIGKMRKPEYFIENQRDGVNPHERIKPNMSTLIIVAHVKDGLVMTREAGVPQPIRDLIPQHHGTRLITYFHKKAGEPADDSEFRYPGPKPQTKEAAIFMLADGVEAAARTLQEPTAARLKGMIRKVTNAVVLDRQLDQCDINFQEIDRIQDAFLKILLSMHHGRIDYPGFDFERRRDRRKDTKVVKFSPGKDR